ncbi:TniQ family protein [Lentibacter sp. XHP0401]|uniref:TniQ family protein n=1 Tax=Lentibacter sp. XHP0401 TaxID=2984334 RepID=UPI0021E85BEC|nr:TniQ family protein [Lentibacter sp. XHP0401]MCV2893720.1 TniQ family protein [Lentibacter sp. XHP0401]
MPNPLPLTVSLLWRETATSFTSRLAARNGLSASAFCSDFGVSLRSIVDGNPVAICAIAELGGVDPEKLAAWSPVAIGERRLNFRGHVFHGKTLRNPEIRGCPICLQEDSQSVDLPPEQAMAIRGHWSVPHVATCVRHGHPLVLLYRDPHPTARYDNAQHLAAISTAVLNGALDQPCEEDLTAFEDWLDERLLNGPGTDWLSGQPLHAASVFCRLLGTSLLRLEGLRLTHIAEDSRHGVYAQGFEVAQHGDEAVRRALMRLQELVESPQEGPKTIYPALYDRLSHDYVDNPDFASFRRVLRDHMAETWPLGPGDELLGEPVHERRLHSVTTASHETGVDTRRLRKQLIASGLLKRDCALPDCWAVFDAKAAAPILRDLTILVSATDFQDLIGATRSQFDLLVADGIIKPALEASRTKSVWDPRAGVELLTKLLRGAVQLRQSQHSWEHISKSAWRLKITPGTIIQAIMEGRLRRIGNLEGKIGYAAVYVDHDEVARLLASDAPPGHSIETFAKSVGVGQPEGLRRLIVDGHTTATRAINPRTKAKQLYITTADADAFHEKFFTPRTMANAYQRSWQSLRAELDRNGVLPFEHGDRNYGRIFLRAKVARVLDFGST